MAAPVTPSKRFKQPTGVIAITDSPGIISCTSSPEIVKTPRNVKLEKFVQMPRPSRNVKVEVKTEKGTRVKSERIKSEILGKIKQEPSTPSRNLFKPRFVMM